MRNVTLFLAVVSCIPATLAKTKTAPIEQAYPKELQTVADKTTDSNAVQFRKLHTGW